MIQGSAQTLSYFSSPFPIREEPRSAFPVSHSLPLSQAVLLPLAKGAALLARVLRSFSCPPGLTAIRSIIEFCMMVIYELGSFGLFFFHFQVNGKIIPASLHTPRFPSSSQSRPNQSDCLNWCFTAVSRPPKCKVTHCIALTLHFTHAQESGSSWGPGTNPRRTHLWLEREMVASASQEE